jgi:pilus assembly protein CpaE
MDSLYPQAIRIVIVAGPDFAREVSALITGTAGGISVEGMAATLIEANRLVLNIEPDVVLIDEEVEGVGALELVESLSSRFPDLATLVALSAGDISRAEQLILGGASAFIVKPFDALELLNTVERVKRLKGGPIPGEEEDERWQGRVIVVCGPKGGVGRTTLAVNLAVALVQISNEGVVLVEASPAASNVDLMLNLHPTHTLADVPYEPEGIDDRLLESILAEHASGIKVLVGRPRLERLEAYRPGWLMKVLTTLKDMARYVVVDLHSAVDETALTAIDLCDWAVLVVTPEITALRPARLFLDMVSEAGLGGVGDKVLLVLNRASSQGAVPTRDIERQMSLKMVTSIPSQGRLVTAAANRGVPVVLGERRSHVARGIIDLARIIREKEGESSDEAARADRLPGLFSKVLRRA